MLLKSQKYVPLQFIPVSMGNNKGSCYGTFFRSLFCTLISLMCMYKLVNKTGHILQLSQDNATKALYIIESQLVRIDASTQAFSRGFFRRVWCKFC